MQNSSRGMIYDRHNDLSNHYGIPMSRSGPFLCPDLLPNVAQINNIGVTIGAGTTFLVENMSQHTIYSGIRDHFARLRFKFRNEIRVKRHSMCLYSHLFRRKVHVICIYLRKLVSNTISIPPDVSFVIFKLFFCKRWAHSSRIINLM